MGCKWKRKPRRQQPSDQPEILQEETLAGSGNCHVVFARNVDAIGKVTRATKSTEQIVDAREATSQDSAVLDDQLTPG